ncbi:hypothetical protein VM1G_01922 [Cytospora mali]|uniref:SnoaL-like domain-containing protein n=1 Tax=Cytospora mali TaxID=578113 RepID=A0A194VSK3_CYTMA|nr:hypothetical protein VM1G_01922 [Valsa mali]
MESKRLQTAKKYIGHFATIDTETLASVLSDDHVHQFAPASLSLPGPFTKQDFLDHSARLRRVMTGFPVYAKEYVESESANQVTVWATSKAQFREEVMDDDDNGGGGSGEGKWVFEGEYVFMLWMDESGEKIRRTVEFLDSKATEDGLRLLMKRANEKVGKGD